MADHKLAPGRNLISALCALGEALGYHVAREYPVEEDRVNPPAVDVAWFAEPDQSYPLMIFEVESRATNSIANNAVKVFGQPSAKFEKPLFFFHIVLRASDSSKLETLERTYGTHNYRNFNLSKQSLVEVLDAVLAQHRRVRSAVALRPIQSCLQLDGWDGVAPTDLLRIVTRLKFVADYEPSMAITALRGGPDLEAFSEWLVDHGGLTGTSQDQSASYGTYLAWDSSHAVHLALAAANRPDRAAEMAQRFRQWEAGGDSVGLSWLGPHFGLNRDYDAFLIGGAPALCAIVGALVPELAPELLGRLRVLRERTGWYGVPNAIWALHLACSVADEAEFDAAREFVNEVGGANEQMTLLPEPFYSTSGDETWPEELDDGNEAVPDLMTFRERVVKALPAGTEPSATMAALRLLADENHSWGPPFDLIASLARPPAI